MILLFLPRLDDEKQQIILISFYCVFLVQYNPEDFLKFKISLVLLHTLFVCLVLTVYKLVCLSEVFLIQL